MTTPNRAPRPIVPGEVQDHPDGRRLRHNIVEVRIPHDQRELSRRLMPDEAAVEDRRFRTVMGGDVPDDDPMYPVSSSASRARAQAAHAAGDPAAWRALDGAEVIYSLMLTETEAAEHRAQPHIKAATVDAKTWHHKARLVSLPGLAPVAE